jgi:hypothetical protein
MTSIQRIYDKLRIEHDRLRVGKLVAYYGEGKKEIDKQLEGLEEKVIPYFYERR